MSTRSVIGKVLGEGKIRYVSAHWDGYPSHNGRILLENYNEEKLDKLLELGDVSILGPEIGEKHPFDANYFTQPDQPKHPKAGWCKFYGRDRGEADIEAKEADFVSLPQAADQCGAEFVYLFENGAWKYAKVPFSSKRKLTFKELTPKVVAKD
jgi:hypothetical protein